MQVPPFLQGFGTQYCRARVNTEKTLFYHISCGVIQGFPALRETVTAQVKNIVFFFTCVDIANQLLKRYSPLAPLGQVDESLHNSQSKLFVGAFSNYGG